MYLAVPMIFVLAMWPVVYRIGRDRGRAEVLETAKFWESLASDLAAVAEYWKASARDWNSLASVRLMDEKPALDGPDVANEVGELERLYNRA
ncbi:MAG TPA: hypothetical protein VJX67_26170, partial [Blastocatellia bacterium]|nr:hypothetical protein [Blastocatellia bacterium]